MFTHRVQWLVGGLVLGLAFPALGQLPPPATRPAPPASAPPLADANRAEQAILQALGSNAATAPYKFSVQPKNGRYVLSGRVGTKQIHDMAIRIAPDTGVPITDQIVIDTLVSYGAAALTNRAYGPRAGVYGSIVGSPVGINSYIYPPPLFGRYDDPFWGLEPPVISYPPWWRSVVYRQPLDSNLTGPYPVPPVGSIPALPPGTPASQQAAALAGSLPVGIQTPTALLLRHHRDRRAHLI